MNKNPNETERKVRASFASAIRNTHELMDYIAALPEDEASKILQSLDGDKA